MSNKWKYLERIIAVTVCVLLAISCVLLVSWSTGNSSTGNSSHFNSPFLKYSDIEKMEQSLNKEYLDQEKENMVKTKPIIDNIRNTIVNILKIRQDIYLKRIESAENSLKYISSKTASTPKEISEKKDELNKAISCLKKLASEYEEWMRSNGFLIYASPEEWSALFDYELWYTAKHKTYHSLKPDTDVTIIEPRFLRFNRMLTIIDDNYVKDKKKKFEDGLTFPSSNLTSEQASYLRYEILKRCPLPSY